MIIFQNFFCVRLCPQADIISRAGQVEKGQKLKSALSLLPARKRRQPHPISSERFALSGPLVVFAKGRLLQLAQQHGAPKDPA
jgi:hypothetical protein